MIFNNNKCLYVGKNYVNDFDEVYVIVNFKYNKWFFVIIYLWFFIGRIINCKKKYMYYIYFISYVIVI